jgi:dihydrolipoamide dehydrogenase
MLHILLLQHGIDVKDVKVNLKQMIKRKADVVKQTCDGINFLMKKNKVTVFTRSRKFVLQKHRMKLQMMVQKTIIESKKRLLLLVQNQ